MYQGSHELQLSQATIWHVLCKHLAMKGYLLQLVQHLKPNGKFKQYFCMEMQADMEDSDLQTTWFSVMKW